MLRGVLIVTRAIRRAAVFFFVLSLALPTPVHGRELSFEERVEAQAAIERVYYSHQIGTTAPFEAAVPRDGIVQRVRAYLDQSANLERLGIEKLTAPMLDREIGRMLRDTRMPARLKEIFAALHDDPEVIRECLARPNLARRLSASTRPDMTDGPDGPERPSEPIEPIEIAQLACIPDDTWTAVTLANAPVARDSHTAVWTGSVMVVWGGFSDFFTQPLASGGRYDPATDTWTAISTLGAPAARGFHSAVWTGNRVVIWGGYGDNPSRASEASNGSRGFDPRLDTGGRYDPATDTWVSTSAVGAPSARSNHTAVWTGSTMVVWGGFGPGALNTGGRYNPVTDQWTTLSTVEAPEARGFHTAVWTGSKMVVWGGYGVTSPNYQDSGGLYDPLDDTWSATSTIGVPAGRVQHTAVWSGSAMLVWGGFGFGFRDDGGRYDPFTNAWATIASGGAPSQRASHTAIWTGQEMVIWGGDSSDDPQYNDSGGRYAPATDTWTSTSTVDVPVARAYHTAIWTGSEMVVWGGVPGSPDLDTGGRYALGTAVDDDGDGTSECQGDCDDTDPSIRPGADEICNGRDDDCNDTVDEGGDALCDDLDPCSTDSCRGADRCSRSPAPGVACEDGNPCTIQARCNLLGVCVNGALLECNDQNPCTADACSSSSGCTHTPMACTSIDFAPAASAVAPGFVKDDGSLFSPARGFGWNAGVDSRERTSAQPLELDTFVFSQAQRTWTAELPIGNYQVCLASGDASNPQGPHRISANGVPLLADVMTAANQFALACPPAAPLRPVAVRTGRLSVTIGGAAGNTLINTLATAPLTAASPQFWSVNFQPAGSTPPPGFLIDSGQTFTAIRGYGWDAALPNRERNKPVPQVLDTFVFSSAVRTWELAVPDGDYDVWYGVGDTDHAQGPHRLEVEGVLAIDNQATAIGSFLEGSTQAQVADGKLTVRIGQGTSALTTLNYLVIAPTDTDADGSPDAQDDCPLIYDPGQLDEDSDRIGFACDNCPHDSNPSQGDADDDGAGDVCDLNDGVIFQFAPSRDRIAWQAETGVTSWNVYQGDLDVLKATGEYTQEPGTNPLAKRHCGVLATWLDDLDEPPVGKVIFSLVTGVQAGVEGDLGQDSEGVERPRTSSCTGN